MLRSVLRTSAEDLAASIATAGELSVVAIAAIDLVHLAAELFVHQGHSAPVAEEAGLVPMLILVRQILQNENPMIKLELLCVFLLYVRVSSEKRNGLSGNKIYVEKPNLENWFYEKDQRFYLCGFRDISFFCFSCSFSLVIWSCGIFRRHPEFTTVAIVCRPSCCR